MRTSFALAVVLALLACGSAGGASKAGPSNTSLPTISGTTQSGNSLTASTGSWSGSPTSYSYQWKRCETDGSGCNDVGEDKKSYKLQSYDVGTTTRVQVKAKNDAGTGTATSTQTSEITAGGPAPENTALPTISGLAKDGSTLTASPGSWSNNPSKYSYTWLRCDGAGNSCGIVGSNQTQPLASGDIGHTLRVYVKASNDYALGKATSAPTAVVTGATTTTTTATTTTTTTTTPSTSSLPVEQISLPQQLVISTARFLPGRLTTRDPFIARFRVTDSRGNLIRGALVYAIALPYGWVRPAAEVTTGADGWATIQFFPMSAMPVQHSALVFFVRARKPGESLLSGVSARRLVQLSIG